MLFKLLIFFKGVKGLCLRDHNYYWSNTTSITFLQQILYEKLLLVDIKVMSILGPN